MQNLPLILKPGKVKSSILLVISIGFVALGISLLESNMLIAIVNIVFFGLCFIVFLLNLIPGSSYLKIDEKGIEMKNLFRTTFIPWQAVDSFNAKWIAFNKLVVFDLNKTLAGEKLKRRQGSFPDTYGMSAAKLAELLNEYKMKFDPTA
ncbi:PH domain-containing protein [Chryseobacterium profundimaris]|uniref:PH domain-containing protein n=1 Tax=Chryseobacterium profundimaris TaxID=1387275 RepID=A0ABY1PBM5_9FLAO|nr:PH domain-containing protein [Chryseobacterium profundimaris]SMP30876.1 PH domain-containing protein [Chryseobacterium profundimaris]